MTQGEFDKIQQRIDIAVQAAYEDAAELVQSLMDHGCRSDIPGKIRARAKSKAEGNEGR